LGIESDSSWRSSGDQRLTFVIFISGHLNILGYLEIPKVNFSLPPTPPAQATLLLGHVVQPLPRRLSAVGYPLEPPLETAESCYIRD
jgi:hypothetical protein